MSIPDATTLSCPQSHSQSQRINPSGDRFSRVSTATNLPNRSPVFMDDLRGMTIAPLCQLWPVKNVTGSPDDQSGSQPQGEGLNPASRPQIANPDWTSKSRCSLLRAAPDWRRRLFVSRIQVGHNNFQRFSVVLLSPSATSIVTASASAYSAQNLFRPTNL